MIKASFPKPYLFVLSFLMILFSNAIAQQKETVVKTPESILQNFMDLRFGMFIHWGPINLRGTEIGWSRGNGNLLYNVGPMPDGRMELRQVQLLQEMGDWLKKYGMSIYSTKGGPYLPSKDMVATRKGNKIYIHILNSAAKSLALPDIEGMKLLAVKYLNGPAMKFNQDKYGISIPELGKLPDENDSVIELEFSGNVEKLALVKL